MAAKRLIGAEGRSDYPCRVRRSAVGRVRGRNRGREVPVRPRMCSSPSEIQRRVLAGSYFFFFLRPLAVFVDDFLRLPPLPNGAAFLPPKFERATCQSFGGAEFSEPATAKASACGFFGMIFNS